MRNPSARLRTRSRLRVVLAAMSLGLPLLTATAAGASETITYSYDARGRLKQVVHSGTVNNGVTTTYGHDKANNRANKTTTGAP
jgi:YD repeat-containing protein